MQEKDLNTFHWHWVWHSKAYRDYILWYVSTHKRPFKPKVVSILAHLLFTSCIQKFNACALSDNLSWYCSKYLSKFCLTICNVWRCECQEIKYSQNQLNQEHNLSFCCGNSPFVIKYPALCFCSNCRFIFKTLCHYF